MRFILGLLIGIALGAALGALSGNQRQALSQRARRDIEEAEDVTIA